MWHGVVALFPAQLEPGAWVKECLACKATQLVALRDLQRDQLFLSWKKTQQPIQGNYLRLAFSELYGVHTSAVKLSPGSPGDIDGLKAEKGGHSPFSMDNPGSSESC